MPLAPADPLPVLSRLALTYAPAAVRARHEALFLLDARLAGIVRQAREPMLAQLRLAWWRESLDRDPATWTAGEPLLARLAQWGEAATGLKPLVVGWEALVGSEVLDATAVEQFARGRASAWSALACAVGANSAAEDASAAAREWALADLAARLSRPEERDCVRDVASGEPRRSLRLPRAMRPLAVLHGLGRRALRRDGELLDGTMALMLALRLGLAGR